MFKVKQTVISLLSLLIIGCGGGGTESGFVQSFSNVTSEEESVNITRIYDDVPEWAYSYYYDSDDMSSFASDEERKAKVLSDFDSIFDAKADVEATVILKLNSRFIPEGFLSSSQISSQRTTIANAQETIITQVEKVRGGKLSSSSFTQFSTIPFLSLKVTKSDAAALASLSEIIGAELDTPVGYTMSESAPLVEANTAWTGGYTGNGTYVAVLDTGVDKTHPFLTNKVASEACYSNAGGIGSGVSVCPGGVTSSTATGSGVNCSLSVKGCDHGTHVAGTIAGFSSTAFSGIAPNSKIIAIQVFTNIGGQALSYTTDQIKALERVYALKTGGMNIASANMSLGGGRYFSACDSSSLKSIIDSLRSVGVATVIASGNNSYTDSVSSPGCISTAVTVGSVGDGSSGTTADVVSYFSNSAAMIDLLAPGQMINSSVPGGGYGNWQGTSMATPHVAGAFAVMKEANPAATVDDLENSLKASGKSVTDTRNNITKPRIKISSALLAMGTGDITVTISPAGAVADGAKWRIDQGAWLNSGATAADIRVGVHTISFSSADSSNASKTWVTPDPVSVTISSDGQVINTAATYTSVDKSLAVKDFNGDSKSDLLFSHSTLGYIAVWELNAHVATKFGFSTQTDGTVIQLPPATWKVMGYADANNDGKSDILLRNLTSGIFYVWLMNSNTVSTGDAVKNSSGTALVPPVSAWDFVAFTDFTGDRKADIMLRSKSNGGLYLWQMDGTTMTTNGFITDADGVTVSYPPISGWAIHDVADTNGDGKGDILFRSTSTNLMYVWFIDGFKAYKRSGLTLLNGTAPAISPTGWEIVGFADTDGDGKSDLIFRNRSSSAMYVWKLDGASIVSASPIYDIDGVTGLAPSISALAVSDMIDANGDGKTDLMFRHYPTGQMYLWTMANNKISSKNLMQDSSGNALIAPTSAWISGF